MKANDITHYRLSFRGRVQGVGFRFISAQIAKDFVVAGFVRNEPDGSVWLEVEGDRREIDSFIAKLKTQMSNNIVSCEMSESKPKGFKDFIIER